MIYGDVASTRFDVAVSDPTLKRLDYVETDHNGARVLGIVERVTRLSALSHEDALAGAGSEEQGRLAAHIHVIGFRDASGRVQVPRTPFAAGATVRAADEGLITNLLGLAKGGAYIGHVKGLDVPVQLSLNTLAQKHLSVLAKTGAGKSYTVGVILEEFLRAKVPLVILDPHGEYGSLRHPNMEDRELHAMVRFGIKPKAFHKQIKEFAIDTNLNPEAEPLRLEGINLEAREIVDILPTKISAGQVGVLYQAVKDVQEHNPAYTIEDITRAVGTNKSNAKWNVLNALEALQATRLFHVRGTPVKDLVKPGQCTIINLKGVSPDIQEVVAGRLAAMLWSARKRNNVPPHILVVEEAHNFCPERGVGTAVSGPVLRTVASEGRKFGMGLVIVSQRPAKVDKNVVSQCNTQVVLKVTNPNDLKAIVASVEGITSETADEVQRLPVGVALIAGGGLTQPVFVDVRPRMTRHGGASIDIVEGGKAVDFTTADEPDQPVPEVQAPPPEPTSNVTAAAADDDEVFSWPPGFAPEPPEATPLWRAEPQRFRPPPTPEPAPEPPAARPPVEPRISAPPPPVARPAPVPRPQRTDAAHTPVRPSTQRPRERRSAEPEPVAPVQPSVPPKPQVAPRPVAPAKPARLSSADLRAVLRVAQRVGLTGTDDPDHAAQIVADLARSDGRHPDEALRQYVQIAQAVCGESTPFCIRCPLREDCQFHAGLQAQRHKERGGIRRLWRKTVD